MAQNLKLSRDQLKVICHDDANAIKQFEKLFAAANASANSGGVVADGDYVDITVSDDGLTWTINPSGVTPGTYTNASVTIDADGRVTAASSGTDAGITELTGDVTAGPGSGSQAATIADTITRSVPFELGLIASTAADDAFFYVSGNGNPSQFVQLLSGGSGEAELRLVPGSGDSEIRHVGTGGGDLTIETSLGGDIAVNKTAQNSDFYVGTVGVAKMLHVDAGLNQVGIGTGTPNEVATVEGRLSLRETTAPSATANYGKFYVKSSDSAPYFMDDSGAEFPLVSGTGSSITADVDLVVSGTQTLDEVLKVGRYRVELCIMVDIVGGSGSDGLLINNANSGGLTFSSTNYAVWAVEGTTPAMFAVGATTSSFVFTGYSSSTGMYRIDGVLDVTVAGTLAFSLAVQNTPTSVTIKAGSFLTVTRIG